MERINKKYVLALLGGIIIGSILTSFLFNSLNFSKVEIAVIDINKLKDHALENEKSNSSSDEDIKRRVMRIREIISNMNLLVIKKDSILVKHQGFKFNDITPVVIEQLRLERSKND